MSAAVVDPLRITNYERTDAELEAFAMFAVIVAGKRSSVRASKLALFLAPSPADMSPLGYVRFLRERGRLRYMAQKNKLGQYGRIVPAFQSLSEIPCLRSVSLGELENIHGIGPKTARFFLLHSRSGMRHAVLDTHILSWMREQGFDAPRVTPNGRRYAELEQAFLRLCDEKGIGPADFDLEVWKERSAPRAR